MNYSDSRFTNFSCEAAENSLGELASMYNSSEITDGPLEAVISHIIRGKFRIGFPLKCLHNRYNVPVRRSIRSDKNSTMFLFHL